LRFVKGGGEVPNWGCVYVKRRPKDPSEKMVSELGAPWRGGRKDDFEPAENNSKRGL